MGDEIRKRIETIREKILDAMKISGVKEVQILAATKTVEPERIKEAIEAGITLIGENRVQEAKAKIEVLGKERVQWHMIGHLQRNKVKHAIKLFDMIESVDSLPLVEELEKRLSKAGKEMEILVEVNIGKEDTKFGVMPEEVKDFIYKLKDYPHLKCVGLMCIPPWFEDPEKVRPYFVQMRRIKEEIEKEGFPHVEMKILSMGMSDDYVIAVEEGANLVRLGRAIFGERKG
ncbi:MAG TPA: YggS family pyridoxal phosphate-dependent enzyme [bacterium]|nr:YggS family pyridoxal phosphate-dependent enzyme [bacterium]HEX67470.1 YggS family pyridoxal phosphate-dependent enzyme [bacterium]